MVNGTVSAFTTVDANTYTFLVTPTISGTTTVDLGATTLTDTAGNPNQAALQLSTTIDLTAPTVTSVTSATANGSRKDGYLVVLQIVFDDVVNVNTVGGTPTLTLETGTTDAVVSYSSGSGTNTLNFNYTIATGENSLDLDYVNTTSLALNGATIRDIATNDATLTLATPGAANSLGANKAIIVDTIAPTIVSIASTALDGSYKIGDVIPLIVTFDEPVNVTGTPQITLETGTTDAVVNYSS